MQILFCPYSVCYCLHGVFTKMSVSIPVTIVIPMYNGAGYIQRVLEGVLSQRYEGRMEVIVVDDGSTDNSSDLVRPYVNKGTIRLLEQSNQGAARATNNGIEAASNSIICLVDSDVLLHQNWLAKIMEEFKDPTVAAVQGYYKTPKSISIWGRVMGYDIEKRYDDIQGKYVTQVCTGNTAYRKKALQEAGLFDPNFTYGYDNDMSYRLVQAGYRLVFRKDALCDHYWKETLASYLKQQYHSAYGRMQLVSRYPDKKGGDSVSGLRMILQVPATMATLVLIVSGAVFSWAGITGAILSAGLLIGLLVMVDRLLFSISVFRKQHDLTAFLIPPVHLIRNIVWCWALANWSLRTQRKKA